MKLKEWEKMSIVNIIWRRRKTNENKTGLRIKCSPTDYGDIRENGMDSSGRWKVYRPGCLHKQPSPRPGALNVASSCCWESRQLTGKNAHLYINQLECQLLGLRMLNQKVGSWAAKLILRAEGEREAWNRWPVVSFPHHPLRKYSAKRIDSLGFFSWLGFALSVEWEIVGIPCFFPSRKQERKCLIYASFQLPRTLVAVSVGALKPVPYCRLGLLQMGS